MKTRTALVASLVLAAGAYYGVQTSIKDPDSRKASFACWWAPSAHRAIVIWRFGPRPPGAEVVTDATRNAPFTRKSNGLHTGDTMRVRITFGPGQPLAGPGLMTACVFNAGANRIAFSVHDHKPMDKTVHIA